MNLGALKLGAYIFNIVRIDMFGNVLKTYITSFSLVFTIVTLKTVLSDIKEEFLLIFGLNLCGKSLSCLHCVYKDSYMLDMSLEDRKFLVYNFYPFCQSL